MRTLALIVLLALSLAADAQVIRRRPPTYYVPVSAPVLSATVQRGVGSIAADDDYTDVDVTAFDSTHTWVIVHAATDSSDQEDHRYTVDIVDNNTIRVQRGDDNGGTFTFDWAVVEDPGLTVARYRGVIWADTLTTVTITSVTTTKTWTYLTCRVDADLLGYMEDMVAAELSSATAVKLRRGISGGANMISYVMQVVSYDSCSVQHGVKPIGSATTTNAAITAVDTAKTFVLHTLHCTIVGSGSNGIDDVMPYATWYSTAGDIDTMRMVRYDDNQYFNIYYQVVSFTDGSLVRPVWFGETTSNSVDVTIATTDTAQAVFLANSPEARYSASSYTGNSYHVVMWYYRFLTLASARLTRLNGDSQTVAGKAFVIEWRGYE